MLHNLQRIDFDSIRNWWKSVNHQKLETVLRAAAKLGSGFVGQWI